MANDEEPPKDQRGETMRAAKPAIAGGGVEIAPGLSISADAIRFAFSSSSGPGGQNVNKRATKAELRVRLADLPLSGDALQRAAELAGRRLTDEGEILITSEVHRSQIRNRTECMERLREIIVQAQVRPRRRRKTKPTRGSVERRIAEKKQTGARKRSRKAGPEDGT